VVSGVILRTQRIESGGSADQGARVSSSGKVASESLTKLRQSGLPKILPIGGTLSPVLKSAIDNRPMVRRKSGNTKLLHFDWCRYTTPDKSYLYLIIDEKTFLILIYISHTFDEMGVEWTQN
jgi:hypothetical protein